MNESSTTPQTEIPSNCENECACECAYQTETVEEIEFDQIQMVVSENYIKRMQTEALYAKMNNESPEFPECPYYMQAYHSKTF